MFLSFLALYDFKSAASVSFAIRALPCFLFNLLLFMYLIQFLVAASQDARCGSARFHEGLCGPFGHSLCIAANHTAPNSAHHLPCVPNLFRSRPTHENWKNTIPDSLMNLHHNNSIARLALSIDF